MKIEKKVKCMASHLVNNFSRNETADLNKENNCETE